jgi:hypothetical protein
MNKNLDTTAFKAFAAAVVVALALPVIAQLAFTAPAIAAVTVA